jgi:hypothetical protein
MKADGAELFIDFSTALSLKVTDVYFLPTLIISLSYYLNRIIFQVRKPVLEALLSNKNEIPD